MFVSSVASARVALVQAPNEQPVATDGEAENVPRLSDSLLGPEGSKTQLARGVTLSLSSGARATPTFTSNLPFGPRGAKVPVQTVEVEGGRIDAILPPESVMRGVLLQAPEKILAISTGGHLSVVISEESIIVAALSGDVLVGQDSKFKALTSGSIRIFSRTSGASRDVALPGKPVLSTDAGLGVALIGSVDVDLKVDVQAPLLLTLVDDQGLPVIASRKLGAGEALRVQVPRAGVYYAVARVLGEGELAGPLSHPLKIQVLGLAPGQRGPEGGMFLLNTNERVHLAGTEGLEVRYGVSPTYVPASSSVGLSQPKETIVEFRNPNDPLQKAQLRIAPRFMKKTIKLGPAGVRWPGDPVELCVGFWDAAGQPLENGKDMDIFVSVNSAQVPVKWRKTGEGLVGTVPQQTGEGPWVVRVNVLDKRGDTIARNFIEVATK